MTGLTFPAFMGNPIALADTPPATTRFPPRLGADTSEVLCELLGLAPSEIDALVRKRVVMQA